MWAYSIGVLVFVMFFVMFGDCDLHSDMSLGAPYKDGKFENLEPSDVGFFDLIKWLLNRKNSYCPSFVNKTLPVSNIQNRFYDGINVVFVGHSTFLIQVDGINILTDPVWSKRVGPVSFVGIKRVRVPGVLFDSLPPVDVVLVSHNHYDHMDMPTLKMLHRKFDPLFLVGLGNKKILERNGISRVCELDWWQSYRVGDCVFNFVPARHFSGRGIFDRNKTLWGGFVIETSRGNIYFAGDTGYGKFLDDIVKRFSPLVIAFLPIGAYKPEWFMSSFHMSPTDAVNTCAKLNPGKCVAMHFGTFKLADDGFDEPILELKKALQISNLTDPEFIVLVPGEQIILK